MMKNDNRNDRRTSGPAKGTGKTKATGKIIATIRCKTIIYISCKPTSLVRDLEVFLAGGYVVEKACAVDQFPWTANVETICRLVLKEDQQKDQ